MAEKRLFKKLPPAPRKKILAYIDHPTYEGWAGIRDLGAAVGMTMYALVCQANPAWEGMYPSAILVARASKLGEQRDEELKAMEM